MTPADLLVHWVTQRCGASAAAWLAAQIHAVANDPAALGPALSAAPRRVGRATLMPSPEEMDAAAQARPGWDPSAWTMGDAARIRLILAAPATALPDLLRPLLAAADSGESVAVFRGLPLYGSPERLVPLATDGLRTAMRTVFEAIAHLNPFPAEFFPQSAWNHMVLKTLFIESTLWPIAGLDGRWNAELAGMLRDYAHERWAAGRPVTPELWRGVGRFGGAEARDDLLRVLRNGSALEREAAALALNDASESSDLLDITPELAEAVRAGRLTWDAITPG